LFAEGSFLDGRLRIKSEQENYAERETQRERERERERDIAAPDELGKNVH
jgi:hypothetical protein